jgi:hypothetical protein
MGQHLGDEGLIMPAPGFVTLICPAGGEGALVSHGPVGYRPYMQNPSDPDTAWLVDVPVHASVPLCDKGGFQRREAI